LLLAGEGHLEGMPDDGQLTVFDTLLLPLRLPGRVVGNIQTLTTAVVALQSDATRHLSSVDESAGMLVAGLRDLAAAVGRIETRVDTLEQDRMDALLGGVAALQAAIDRIEVRVADLESLEATITERVDSLHEDLNARMLEVRAEVSRMRPPMDEMARDVAKIDELLPDPSDGPLTRLKDTLTSSR
jgi:chromosome segregation ATPase